VDFFYAYGLTSEDRAEINFLVAEADASAIRDHNDFVVKGIVDIGQPLVGTRRMLIDLSRTFHVQGFMGTFVVEDLDKVVEAGLLLKEVCGSGLGAVICMADSRWDTVYPCRVMYGLLKLSP
jgi:hypothetical protein